MDINFYDLFKEKYDIVKSECDYDLDRLILKISKDKNKFESNEDYLIYIFNDLEYNINLYIKRINKSLKKIIEYIDRLSILYVKNNNFDKNVEKDYILKLIKDDFDFFLLKFKKELSKKIEECLLLESGNKNDTLYDVFPADNNKGIYYGKAKTLVYNFCLTYMNVLFKEINTLNGFESVIKNGKKDLISVNGIFYGDEKVNKFWKNGFGLYAPSYFGSKEYITPKK